MLQMKEDYEGKAVQIISLESSTDSSSSTQKSLVLNKAALKSILHGAGQRKLAILSMVGPLGTGKSFMLSLIIRYLESLTSKNLSSSVNVEVDWILGSGPVKGFFFESSIQSVVTKGISMWSKPFIIMANNGDKEEELALFLMDTRGIFDKQSTLSEQAAIVGCAYLLSTTLIFNVSRLLQEDSLQILDAILQHGRLLVRNNGTAEEEVQESVCQNITFLIRDWNIPGQYKFGPEGGQSFLNSQLTIDPSLSAESNSIRESIKKCFKNLDCILLPHPGEGIAEVEFENPLESQMLSSPFCQHLELLMSHFFAGESGGKFQQSNNFSSTIANLVTSAENYVHIFNMALAGAKPLKVVAAEMYNNRSIQSKVEEYQSILEDILKTKWERPKVSNLKKAHAKAMDQLQKSSLQIQSTSVTAGESESSIESRQWKKKLDDQIDTLYVHFKQDIQRRQEVIASDFVQQITTLVESKMATITLIDCVTPQKFETVWNGMVMEAKENFRKMSKKMGKKFLSKYTPLLEARLKLVYGVTQTKNDEMRTKLADKYQNILDQALELYEDKMAELADDDQVDEKKLERLHQNSAQKAVDVFKKKIMNYSERDQPIEMVEEFSTMLKTCMEKWYAEAAQKYQNAIQVEKNLAEQIVEKLYHLYVNKMAADIAPFHTEIAILQQDKLDQIHKSVQNEVLELLQNQKDEMKGPKIFLHAKKSLMLKIEEKFKEIVIEVKGLVEKEETEEAEMCENLYRKFWENVNDHPTNLTSMASDPSKLSQILDNEKQTVVKIFNEKYSQKLNSNHFHQFEQRIDQKIQELIQANNNNVHRATDLLIKQYETALASYRRKIETLDFNRFKFTSEFENIQKNLQTETVIMFQNYFNNTKILHHLRQQYVDKLDEEICKMGQNQLEKIKQQIYQRQLDDCREAEEMVMKTFQRNFDSFYTQFDLIPKKDFDQHLQGLKATVLRRARRELEFTLDAEVIDGMTSQLKIKLENVHQELWTEQEVRNGETETKIKTKMATLMKSYVQKLSGSKEAFDDDDYDDVIENFSTHFKCTSSDVLRTYERDLELELEKLRQNSSSKSLAQANHASNQQSLSHQNLGGSKPTAAPTPRPRTKLLTDCTDVEKTDGDGKSLENLEKEKPKEYRPITEIIEEAVKKYQKLMSHNFTTPIYYDEKKLTQLHGEVVRDTLDQFRVGSYDSKNKSKIHTALTSAFGQFEKMSKMNAPTSFAIGIDLGTTYSCVGVYINGKVEIIPNEQGNKTTPSYVSFADYAKSGKILVGEEAKNQSHVCPEKTIYEVKRLIGRKFEDPAIQDDIAKWPFKVVQERGKPKILIDDKTYHPEQISSEILVKLKKVAEAYLKQPVQSAVITVPAYFTDGQRLATKNAGEAAGLEVLKIINEPTAAAIAYNLNWTASQISGGGERRGLVFDLGGGTFDVAIFSASHGNIQILNVGGDTHLGGVDFDNQIVDFCVAEFKKIEKIDLFEDRQSNNLTTRAKVNRKLMRLKGTCERHKKSLSTEKRTNVIVDCIHDQSDLDIVLERSKFEQLIEPLIKKSLECVERTLVEAKLKKHDLHEIVLVGGSTRVPRLREALKKFFDGKELSTSVDPDEAVAIGAAFEAAVLNGAKAQASGDIRSAAIAPKGWAIKDVTPMSMGIEVDGGRMSVLIMKQSQIPTEVSNNYKTSYNNQTSVQIVVYEGEDLVARNNTLLGEFYLNGIPPAEAGHHTVKVTMKVSNEGIMHVTASCIENGVVKQLTVRANKQQMSAKDMADIRKKI